MSENFATKLKITAAALGCNTQKELSARFRAANPDTSFDPTRAYKWVQGRSRPRDWQLYDDWALVLDLGKSGQFLRNCALTEFVELVGRRYDLPATMLRSLVGAPPEPAIGTPATPPGTSPHAYLAGTYTAYSPAWSPAAIGRLVRATMTIEASGETSLDVRYVEPLFDGDFDISGKLSRSGRSLSVALHGGDLDIPMFLCLSEPAPPALLLPGVMSGAVVHDAEARPTAGRIVCVRHRIEAPAAPGRTAYLEPDRDVLASELERIGYPATHTPELATMILGFVLEENAQPVVDAPQTSIGDLMRAFYRACLDI